MLGVLVVGLLLGVASLVLLLGCLCDGTFGFTYLMYFEILRPWLYVDFDVFRLCQFSVYWGFYACWVYWLRSTLYLCDYFLKLYLKKLCGIWGCLSARYWTGQGWHTMSCVQYRYKGKWVTINIIIITKRFVKSLYILVNLIYSSDVFLDTTHCL